MTSCFSLPWFLVVVLVILSILIAVMWFCEHTEKEYLKNKDYQEINGMIFLNKAIFEENKLLHDELMEYKRLALEFRCLNAKEFEKVLKQLNRSE